MQLGTANALVTGRACQLGPAAAVRCATPPGAPEPSTVLITCNATSTRLDGAPWRLDPAARVART